MRVSYDPVKNARNVAIRRLSFDRAYDFEFGSAHYFVDSRTDYGQTRYIAVGYLDNRLHVLCFTETEDGIRVISFRKANSREANKYERPLTVDGPRRRGAGA